MEFKYYPFRDIVMKSNSKCEVLYRVLMTIESDISANILNELILLRNTKLSYELAIEIWLRGIYTMICNGKIVSCAFIKKNTIDRIITLPNYRNKGYATKLIKKIVENMSNCDIKPVWSPLDPKIIPFFEKIGWCRCLHTINKDGTIDYCPKEQYSLFKKGITKYSFQLNNWINFTNSIE